jgi:hypothetical protein
MQVIALYLRSKLKDVDAQNKRSWSARFHIFGWITELYLLVMSLVLVETWNSVVKLGTSIFNYFVIGWITEVYLPVMSLLLDETWNFYF